MGLAAIFPAAIEREKRGRREVKEERKTKKIVLGSKGISCSVLG